MQAAHGDVFAGRLGVTKTVEHAHERQQSTPVVSVPSIHDFTDNDIPSNFNKITGVSTPSPLKSQQY